MGMMHGFKRRRSKARHNIYIRSSTSIQDAAKFKKELEVAAKEVQA